MPGAAVIRWWSIAAVLLGVAGAANAEPGGLGVGALSWLPDGAYAAPIACTEGRPYVEGEVGSGPVLIARRCVRPKPLSVGTAEAAKFADYRTGRLYRYGGWAGGTSVLSSSVEVSFRSRVQFASFGGFTDPAKWPPRMAGMSVFDPVARRFVHYGGMSVSNLLNLSGIEGNTQVLDFSSVSAGWKTLPIAAPGPARYWGAAAYDPVGHRMFVYGGRGAYDAPVGNQTLELKLTKGAEEWSVVPVASAPAAGAQERIGAGLAYDRVQHRLLLVGGGKAYGVGGPMAYSDVWALDLLDVAAGWKQLVPLNSGPVGGMIGVRMFCSPHTGDCYVHDSGFFDPPESYGLAWDGYSRLETVWRIRTYPDGTFEWTKVRTVLPGGRALSTSIFWMPDLNLGFSIYGEDESANYIGLLHLTSQWRVYSLVEEAP